MGGTVFCKRTLLVGPLALLSPCTTRRQAFIRSNTKGVLVGVVAWRLPRVTFPEPGTTIGFISCHYVWSYQGGGVVSSDRVTRQCKSQATLRTCGPRRTYGHLLLFGRRLCGPLPFLQHLNTVAMHRRHTEKVRTSKCVSYASYAYVFLYVWQEAAWSTASPTCGDLRV